jgi:hypothetical protein
MNHRLEAANPSEERSAKDTTRKPSWTENGTEHVVGGQGTIRSGRDKGWREQKEGNHTKFKGLEGLEGREGTNSGSGKRERQRKGEGKRKGKRQRKGNGSKGVEREKAWAITEFTSKKSRGKQ